MIAIKTPKSFPMFDEAARAGQLHHDDFRCITTNSSIYCLKAISKISGLEVQDLIKQMDQWIGNI